MKYTLLDGNCVHNYPLLCYSRRQLFLYRRMSKKGKEKKKNTSIVNIFLLSFIVSALFVWLVHPLGITRVATAEMPTILVQQPEREGKYIIVYLQKMELELRDGGTILKTLPILSIGKPSSYYETIGGVYINDYKVPLHLSSLGHVYMPHSVHLFGNYFIHGVPYYPNGNRLSNTYSGGCIRLTDENASIVYDFVQAGMPIIITKEDGREFTPTQATSSAFASTQMTNLMVASISLELLSQDDQIITDTDGFTKTTRRAILHRLVRDGDTSVSKLYAESIGEKSFLSAMNKKAEALGLTNTRFLSIDSPVITSSEDYIRFMNYITVYKSYIQTLQKEDTKEI